MNISQTVLLLTGATLFSGSIADDDAGYIFRNDVRPAYEDSVSVEQLAELQADENVILLDVRLLEDFEAYPVLIPGAEYKNPEDIEAWSSTLPQDSKVIVYCVKGRWVSQKAANYLNDKGIEVSSLEGGIVAWDENKEE